MCNNRTLPSEGGVVTVGRDEKELQFKKYSKVIRIITQMCNNWTLPFEGGVATVGGDKTEHQFIIINSRDGACSKWPPGT